MTPDPWLSMRFQVAVQYVDRPSKGRWFDAELGDWYQARVAEVRQQDEMAAQKKAEEDKRMAEWTARREKERLEEEAKAEQERQLAERTAAQTAMRAQRDAATQQQRAQEMLAPVNKNVNKRRHFGASATSRSTSSRTASRPWVRSCPAASN